MRRFPWILTVASALALAVLVTLGAWQVRRLQWKADLIARAEAAAVRPPAPATDVLRGDAPEFRRVVLDCPGLPTAAWVELQSIYEGRPGVRLISACPVPGLAQTVLVDRGFVEDTISARPPVGASSRAFRLVAVVRATPAPGPMALAAEGRRFFARDGAAMARALDVEGPVAPWTLFAVTSSNPEWRALTPSAPPAAFSNNHLGYAITWFGLAVALIGVYLALLRRKLRSDPEKGSS